MCGIVGAIGSRNIVSTLIEGLSRLEYRGYDSAGVATLVDGGIDRRRVIPMSITLSSPTAARWASFNWRVVDYFRYVPPADVRDLPPVDVVEARHDQFMAKMRT